MKIHPITNCYPMMSATEMAGLIADISKRGLLFPVTVHGDTLIDGRNRVEACKAAGVELRTVEYDGDDVAAFIHSTNERRDLTPSQRAMIAARIANLNHGGDRRSDQAAKPPLEVTQAEAAAALNVPERTVRAAKAVLDADPELAEKVAQGKVRVYVAEQTIRSKARNVARDQPDLSRRQTSRQNAKPRAERVAEIKRMTNEGHNVDQIAEELGIDPGRVRVIINQENIQVAPHTKRGPSGRITAARVIEETVNALSGCATGLQVIRNQKLVMTQDQAAALWREARESLKAINWAVGQLREVANG